MRHTVCPHDTQLHAKRRGVLFTLSPAPDPHEASRALEDALELAETIRESKERPDDDHIDIPEDCSIPCWRKEGGTLECRCDDEHEDGTTSAPGGW